MAGHDAYGCGKVAYRVFVGKTQDKILLARSRLGWEDNIRKDVKELGWDSID